MSLRDELLKPIAGPNPGGVDLRYDPIYDKIKEARREDDDTPQGGWTTARKVAEWPVVIKLATEALTTKSKDLQLGAWLTEAMLRREGFGGLRSGLDVLGGLVEEHWDHLFPAIDDGDAEMRAAPLDWVGLKLEIPVRMVPLDRSGFTTFQHKEARLIPTETAAGESDKNAAARKAAIAAKKKTPEDIEAAFTATPKAFYKTLVGDINGSLASLDKLRTIADAKFGNAAPSFAKLRDVLEDVQRIATQQLKVKLELEPDPVDVAAAPEADGAESAASSAAAAGPMTPEPTSRDDATSRIVVAARFLRRTEPFNPAAYLLLRGLRWGELRVSPTLDPRLLEAPPTSVRTMLKGLLLDSRWPELLEACEGVMGTAQGRGWLDLQRYVLRACDALGKEYLAVGTAMRGALRSLLADRPQLLDMTLMDDTPTANPETRGWLRTEMMLPQASAEGAAETASGNDGTENGTEPSPREAVAFAMAEARAGRADRAISMLMREVAREKTSRGRFLVQAQLARIMVDAGHDAVATPILEELIANVEKHQLEQWEAGELVATPMALMYRLLTKTKANETQRQNLYLRICRLDPIQAINFSQS